MISGATYPVRALVILARTPALWRFIAIPLVVNLVVGLTIYLALLVAGMRAVDGWAAGLPAWASAFGFVLRAILIVGLFLGTGFVLARFGVVLGAPWYSALSERLERLRLGDAVLSGATGVRGAVGDLLRALRYEMKKLLLVVILSVLLLTLNIVPVAGTVVAAGGALALGATVACLDFLDGPLERRRLGFREKLGVIGRALPGSASFGLVCFFLVSVPFLNLLTIPICVAAGTLFYCDRVRLRDSQ